jgi:hypothetical protein
MSAPGSLARYWLAPPGASSRGGKAKQWERWSGLRTRLGRRRWRVFDTAAQSRQLRWAG